MSDISKNSLKNRLEKLQCHFTWNLLGEDVDIDSVEERLCDQIAFLEDEKHRMYNLLAYLKYLRGDHAEAMFQLQKAETVIQESYPSEDSDFKRTVMYGNYAWLCYHQDQYNRSCTYADKVEAILKKYESPLIQNTLLIEIYGEQGWTYLSFTGEYYIKAAECFGKGLKLDPENPDLNSGYAMAVYRVEDISFPEKLASKSIPLLERAVALNPKDTVMKTLLALKYQDSQMYKQGEILIEQALREKPESPYVLRYAGKFYRRARITYKGIEILKRAIDLTPTSCALHYQLALCYKNLTRTSKQFPHGQSNYRYTQQRDEAISNAKFHFEKAVELDKSSVMAHILLADIYVIAHEYQKAEETFSKTLMLRNISCTQKQDLHLNWARYELNCRKSESESIKHFKEVIMITNPTRFRKHAIQDLEKLAEYKIRQSPADGYGLLGFIHHHQGQHQPAIRYYEKALQHDPDNKEYLEALFILQTKSS